MTGVRTGLAMTDIEQNDKLELHGLCGETDHFG